jgi:hypothetical protein
MSVSSVKTGLIADEFLVGNAFFTIPFLQQFNT